jgi:hypothetical protein
VADCAICARPQPDTAVVCHVCARGTADALLQLARLTGDGDLAAQIARQGRIGSGGGNSDGVPLPVDLRAAQRASLGVTVIVSFALETARAQGLRLTITRAATSGPYCEAGCGHTSCRTIATRRRAAQLPALCRWLASQVGWMRRQPDAVEMFGSLERHCQALERMVDRPDPGVLVGVCECGATIYARHEAGMVRCKVCRTQWDVQVSREILRRRLDDQLMTPAEIARLAAHMLIVADREKTRRLINKWAQRSMVVERGRSDDGPTYRFGEVITRLTRASNATVSSDRTGEPCPIPV